MSDMKKLLEAVAKFDFPGERTTPAQTPGDQVRGTEVAKPGKKHPFLHRLVGSSKENKVKNKLLHDWSQFKEAKADEYELRQPKEQTAMDVLFQTAAQAMVNASREGEYLDTEDAIRMASKITKIPYVPSQLPVLQKQLANVERQIATMKTIKKAQAAREKEKLTHQPDAEELRRRAEFEKSYGDTLTKNLRLRSEDINEANEELVGRWVVSKSDGWAGEVLRTENGHIVVSDGHELRRYEPDQVEVKESTDLDEFAPPVVEDGTPNTVTMDVPLMIRLFEYAREDAKDDMDLHFVAERLIELSQDGRTLSMDDYDAIVGSSSEVKESSEGFDSIVRALTNRIIKQHSDMLLTYGPEKVLDAIRDEAEFIGDVEELGSSDLNIAIDNVFSALRQQDTVTEEQIDEYGTYGTYGTTGGSMPADKKADTDATQDAKEIAQTQKSLQNIKGGLSAAGAGSVDVQKLTQVMSKVDDNPTAKPVGTDLQALGALAPAVADVVKHPETAQQFKQAIQKAQTLDKIQAQKKG